MAHRKCYTRRTMLKGMGIALGAGMLTGCRRAAATPEPTALPAATAVPPTPAPTATPEPTVVPMTAGGALPTPSQFVDFAFASLSNRGARAQFPVSFLYDGKAPASFLPAWQAQWTAGQPKDGITAGTATLSDPKTGLQCRVEVKTYADAPAVEWVAYLKNTGTANTPLIENIQPLSATFPLATGQVAQVHHANGSLSRADDFAPKTDALAPGADFRLANSMGRSSNGALPFFNLDLGQGCIIGAVGWSGDWAATFKQTAGGVAVRAGMQQTRLTLHPDEEIRTPRMLLLFWPGGRVQAHNAWRRLILAHYTPQPNGELLQVPVCTSAWGASRLEDHVNRVKWIQANKLAVDTFWIDAGWHGDAPFNPADVMASPWDHQVGNWFPNKAMFPEGLKPIGDACKEAGLRFLVWFEPERVFKGTQWAREHPEYLFPFIGENALFNLGNSEARQFLTAQLSRLITDSGITVFRSDFNIEPAHYWKAADTPDRIGMSEIRYVEGLYAYWDELLARHPGLIIDNCASGGRRIDLETTMRAVPLWRSDWQVDHQDPTAQQTQTHGLSWWVPLSAGSCQVDDWYAFRSTLGPGIVVGWAGAVKKPEYEEALKTKRELLLELATVRKYFYGDYYPLTPYSEGRNAWCVWQFDRPDLAEGMLLALRRPADKTDKMNIKLLGLDAGKAYELRCLDNGKVSQANGRDLLEKGMDLELYTADCTLYVYKQL